MIVPVGINHVIRGWPRVTIALIVACTLLQIYEDTFAPSADEFEKYVAQKIRDLPPDADEATQQRWVDDIEEYAKRIPSFRFGYRTDSGLSYQLVTSAFVHVGWLHLIGNMLFLWLAGAALEDRWGRARFAAFYVAGAVVSALGFAASHSGSAVHLVGASGAVSALMGAFLVFFARTQIHFVYWFGRGFGRFDAVAYVVLPLWLVEQVIFAWLESDSKTASVAFSAHIAGFAFGVVVALVAKVLARKSVEEAAGKEVVAAATTSPPPIAPPPVIAPRAVEPPKAEPVEPGEGPRFLT